MTAQNLADRPNRIIKLNERQEYKFEDNFVKTSVYEWYNFVPKFLCIEFNPFKKIANVYFLIVSAMQVSSSLSLLACN